LFDFQPNNRVEMCQKAMIDLQKIFSIP